MEDGDMMKMPLISVIVPVYNGEKYIPMLFDSLITLNSSIFNEFEIIAVNDGSKDSSLHVLNEYSSKYPNIKTIDKANGGIASARNAGLAHATGKYVAFCDQDDSLKKGYAKFIQKMEELECDLIITNHENSNGECKKFQCNEICGRDKVKAFALYMLAYGFIPYEQSLENALCDVSAIWNCIFRRDFLNKHEIRFKSFVDYEDDWKFMTQSLVYANKIYLDTDGFYCWTINPDSESHTHKYISDYLEKRQRLMEWICRMLRACGVREELIDDYRHSPGICRSVIIDCFYNACALDYKQYLMEMRKLGNAGYRISSEVQKKAKTRPQRIFLLLLKFRMYRFAYILNKYFLKRFYH